MTTRGILLDTCAAIWLAQRDPLSEDALVALRQTLSNGHVVAVSPMTAWEIGLLASRGRLILSMDPPAWFNALMALPGLTLAALTPEILTSSSFLPADPPRDPADRIIIATARAAGYRLITRDRLMLRYADDGHVAALAC